MTHCSFCGRDETEAEVIVTGLKVAICGECVDLAMKKVTEYRQRPRPHLFPGETHIEMAPEDMPIPKGWFDKWIR